MSSNTEFHIFRDVHRRIAAADLVSGMRAAFARVSAAAQLDELLSLLLLAGELECALADAAGCSAEVAATARLTSLLAGVALRCDSSGWPEDSYALSGESLQLLQTLTCSGILRVSAPEGFAYYALHPFDYADLIARLKLELSRAVVIGIRSIGTTLSAVVTAKLGQLGVVAERTTVRPTGHPYQRICEFNAEQRQTIERAIAAGAGFIVCDEGPGRSGSSLISVAEALEREGVPRGRILLLGSHEPDVSRLCAPDAARRWLRYRSAATGMTQRLPPEAKEYIGGGEWRRKLFATGEPWPAVWPQMERLKYLSGDGRTMLTFEGHGPYGAAASDRNAALSNAGFGLAYAGHRGGFGCHQLRPGRVARRNDLTSKHLAHMAHYCAWRARAFAVSGANACDLENIVRCNFEREFGFPPRDLRLSVEHAMICDNRMAPQYWLLTAQGEWRKLDGAIHGDDHFFPGPCDVAWDLAGITVEWQLSSSEREFLLSEYRCASGDNADERIPHFEFAYAIFRLAWSKMALASVAGTEEEPRLLSDYGRYRRCIEPLEVQYETRRPRSLKEDTLATT